jgi:ubiquinone/menaquinone biosynthesis C-methylase UbiE
MTNFVDVTELSGDRVTKEQVQRIVHRYQWAGKYCSNKDVLEVACGTGQGLGYLLNLSKSFEAGDYSKELLAMATKYYGERVSLTKFDAQDMPYKDSSKDVIILFEAIYYIPDPEKFVAECKRVLRLNGIVLISVPNNELEDFNPSPYSFNYYNKNELAKLFSKFGFQSSFYGYMEVDTKNLIQKILIFIKKMTISFRLMPKTMAGKKLLKRLVFGKLIPMPSEISGDEFEFLFPAKLNNIVTDKSYKVIYSAAILNNK